MQVFPLSRKNTDSYSVTETLPTKEKLEQGIMIVKFYLFRVVPQVSFKLLVKKKKNRILVVGD